MSRRGGTLLVVLVLLAGVAAWWELRRSWDGADSPGVTVRPAAPEPRVVPPDVTPVPPSDVPAPPAPLGPAPRREPPAGVRLPFVVGETARYQVEWLGLGTGVSAGTADFLVTGPTARGAAFSFELTAVTAPWVSTFFEARDWFATAATRDLYPVEHRQELREGRRRVSRLALYDATAGLVRVGDGVLASPADGVTRPFPRGARDPLGAMYFLRTVEWQPGQLVRLLVSDLGLTIGVDVQAELTEPVKAEGRSQLARRLTARFSSTEASIPVPSATVWMSTDARRIPLAAQVESQYGVFRLSLVHYAAVAAGAARNGEAPRTRVLH